MPNNTPPPPPLQYYQQIINATLQYYQITFNDLYQRQHVDKKKILHYLLRTEADMKYIPILKLFNANSKSYSYITRNVEEISARKNISRAIRTDIENILQLTQNKPENTPKTQ